MSKKLISSHSGIRGIVGETLTAEIVLDLALAFGRYIGSGSVIVGGDTRESHDFYKETVITGLISVGIDVIDIGKVPTPTCQQMIRVHKAQGAMIITASHNPIAWNGIKLMNASGAFLNAKEYQAFKSVLDPKNDAYKDWPDIGSYTEDPTAIDQHIDKILSLIDGSAIQKTQPRVLLDPNNGAGCIADKKLMEKLGIPYTMINQEPNGQFAHDPEPLEKNLTATMAAMKTEDFDIGFIQDADADRLVILDESGHFIGEDYSLGFCIDYVLSLADSPKNSIVVVNLSTSQVIEAIADNYQAKTVYTKIGETYVTERIKSEQAIVGGEGNGGIIYPKVGWGRDSLVGIVLALCHLSHKKQTVSDIVATYPKYVMRRAKMRAMGSVLEGRTWIQAFSKWTLMPSSVFFLASGK